ncbi:glycerophosphoryl diester phosphodiesterase [Enterococcus sp. AZ194]|uniref:glycerophosphodiester phosphodiesterase family protein n=1 Tax=Enterococcus sp. AZ194 TaxID=2774629 RepID=UPI003F235E36
MGRMFDFGGLKKTTKGWFVQLVSFVVVFNFIQLFLIQPLLNFIFRIGLNTSGYQVLFNNEMLEYFLTPVGFLSGGVSVVLVLVVSLFEFSILIEFTAEKLMKGEALILRQLENFRLSKRMIRPLNVVLTFVYVFLFLPIVNLGYTSSLFPFFKIPNFITGELAKSNYGEYLILFVFSLIYLGFFLSLYILPSMVLERTSLIAANKSSVRTIKRNVFFFLKLVVGYLFAWGLLKGLPELAAETFYLPLSVVEYRTIFQSGSILQIIGCFLFYLYYQIGQLLVAPLLIALLTFGFCHEKKEFVQNPQDSYSFEKIQSSLRKLFLKKVPRVILAALFVASVFMFTYRTLEDGADLHEPIVIGHRGSVAGVENTIEAIQGAIDAKAEYAEVDILLSKDGVPMVIHDDSLERLAGVNKFVHELTAEELGKLQLKQNGLTGKISTLDDVLAFTEGKIQLAVELKLHKNESKNLVDEVAKVMATYGVLESAVFLSLDYSLVDEMNTKYPNTTSGYCIFGNIGYLNPTVIYTMNIDFVLIEEWMATRTNLMEFRRAWLPTYVWTANEPDEMIKFLKSGALGLVTDYPKEGVEQRDLFEEESYRSYLKPEDWQE